MMYDIIAKTVDLTEDEMSIIIEALEWRQDHAVSVAEVMTIENLLDKLE